MAATNHERVGRALELLRQGLAPFVHSAVKAKAQTGTVRLEDIHRWTLDQHLANKPIAEWDAAGLLKLMWDMWNEVFRKRLGFPERSLVSELRDWRNKWAHQERFVNDDADRALDSAERLLKAIDAPQAEAVACIKRELRQIMFDDQAHGEVRRTNDIEPSRETAPRHTDAAAKAAQPPVTEPPISQADAIRRHALRHYVEPWRNSNQERLSIRAGDVHKELHLRSAAPNVCNALGGRKFLALANVKLVGHTEPCPSTTTVFHYERT